jgi:hypothetical protein
MGSSPSGNALSPETVAQLSEAAKQHFPDSAYAHDMATKNDSISEEIQLGKRRIRS